MHVKRGEEAWSMNFVRCDVRGWGAAGLFGAERFFQGCTMNAVKGTQSSPTLLRVVRWIARAASVVSIVLLAAFAFGERGMPTAKEWLALAMFPGGVVAGMVWAWWSEVRGGLLTLASLIGIHAWMFVRDGKIDHGPYFALFALPGIVLLACGVFALSRPQA